MAKKMLALALVAGCLLGVTEVRAQSCPSCYGQPCLDSMAGGGWGAPPPENAPPGPYINPSCPEPPQQLCAPYIHMPESCPPEQCCWKRGWFSAEYLLGWLSNPHTQFPLVTTAVNGGNGVIGDPRTIVLLNGPLAISPLSGGRGTAGVWFDHDMTAGLEFSGFGMEAMTKRQVFQSDGNGNPPLSVPFFNLATQAENFVPIAAPGADIGKIIVTNTSRLYGAEASFVLHHASCCLDCQLLLGYRYARFEDKFTMQDDQITLPAPGTFNEVNDYFKGDNTFNGGQIGLRTEMGGERFGVIVVAKAAIGATHQVITINGSGTTSTPAIPVPATTPGGIFAVNGNIGQYSRDVFGFMPEADFKFAWHLTNYWTMTAGYQFLWWNRVVRGIDQVNRVTNRTEFNFPPGAAVPANLPGVPAVPFAQRSIWLQGLTVGIELAY